MRHIFTTLLFALYFFSGFGPAIAGNYSERREIFIKNALSNPNDDAITLQAFRHQPVDQAALTRTLNETLTVGTADFRIVKLIRVLFFSNGEYDDQILPVFRQLNFWLQPGEDRVQYWSENHLIMWMSSNWLLHEKYGWEADASLRQRLVHYLQLKNEYGFYEFFSSTYSPYCLSGLLNLADFATDQEIKELATKAAQRLMKDLLLVTNDKGVMYPCAGRNYNSKYEKPYGENHSNILYLLTGFGEVPLSGSHASNFLASSSVPMDEVINSWTPELNISYKIGHSLQKGFELNSVLNRRDRVMFQWSSGAYFHPDVAADSYWLIDTMQLYNLEEFRPFAFLFNTPQDLSGLAEPLSTIIASASRSSVICGQTVNIFKNKSVVLSSIQDFWKGRLGYQQWPWAAAVGTASVFTQSGKVRSFENRDDGMNMNASLPYIKQVDNVALIMYRPNWDLPLIAPILGIDNFDVGLRWPEEQLDETRENGYWILGRQGDSYVAVRRHCVGEINGIPACDDKKGQTWAVIVGNEEMYGSFDNFEDIINRAQYEERWSFDARNLKWIYYGRIAVDGKDISYSWGGNILQGPRRETGIEPEITIYPNPARDYFTIDMSGLQGLPTEISIVNLLGQVVFSRKVETISESGYRIESNNWPNGMYTILMDVNGEILSKKVIISK